MWECGENVWVIWLEGGRSKRSSGAGRPRLGWTDVWPLPWVADGCRWLRRYDIARRLRRNGEPWCICEWFKMMLPQCLFTVLFGSFSNALSAYRRVCEWTAIYLMWLGETLKRAHLLKTRHRYLINWRRGGCGWLYVCSLTRRLPLLGGRRKSLAYYYVNTGFTLQFGAGPHA